MKKILGHDKEYKFVPGVGIKSSKIFPLISFCIGYGLEWILIMDNGINPDITRTELLINIFSNDEKEITKKVKILDFKEVEDMFSIEDLKLIDPRISISRTKLPSELIGNRKIMFAKDFFKNVEKGTITKKKLSPQTIKNFENIFDFINTSF